MKPVRSAFALLTILALFACAKPPQAEIDAAKDAVAKAAANKDVVTYAPESLQRAQDALVRMQTELTAKRYAQVKAAAIEASAAAEKAAAEAVSAKAKVKADAAALIAAMKKALPEAERTVASARKVRGTGLDFGALAKSLAEAKSSIADAERDFANSEFMGAWVTARGVQTVLADSGKTVADAVQAATKKK